MFSYTPVLLLVVGITALATTKSTSTVAAFSATTTTTASSTSKVPSWETLLSLLPTNPSSSKGPAVYTMKEVKQNPSILDNTSNDQYVLFRDVNAFCPYAQRVWLALEVKQLNYITILTDNDDEQEEEEEEHPFGPRLRLPDKKTIIYDSIQALEEIQKLTPDRQPNLFPKVSGSVDGVRANINRRAFIFPRNTIFLDNTVPSLFKMEEGDDDKIVMAPKTPHDVTCEEIEEMLEEYPDGPFLCGAQITAADIAWMPFVERYVVQLPLLHPSVQPRSNDFPEFKAWLDAMERTIPSYSCAVRGDAKTYSSQLYQAMKKYGLDDSISVMMANVSKDNNNINKDMIGIKRRQKRNIYNPNEIWSIYTKDKEYLADNTPNEECASCITQLRDEIKSQFVKHKKNDGSSSISSSISPSMNEEEMDMALRQVVHFILTEFCSDEKQFGYNEDALLKLSGDARDVASFVNDYICVPRDMGAIPAAVLRRLVLDAPKPRIK